MQLLLWAGALFVFGGVLMAGSGGTFVDAWAALFTRGPALTDSHFADKHNVAEDPAALAAACSAKVGQDVSLDLYALARMIASEDPANVGKANVCRAWTALNDAEAHFGGSAFACVTASSAAGRRGGVRAEWFGHQWGRRYSTANDPHRGHLDIARAVWDAFYGGRRDSDPTGGAEKFLNVSGMGGVQKGTGSYDSTLAQWEKGGLVHFTIEGVTGDLVFFRRRGAAVAVLEDTDPDYAENPEPGTLPEPYDGGSGEGYA